MLYYITGNQNKKDIASKFLSKHGIKIKIKDLNLIEIQSNSLEEVILHKANDAFKKLKKPLFVNDHFWSINALNGFPGAYMKYINNWFTSEDLLILMSNKNNRSAKLKEAICYIDNKTTKIFLKEYDATVLYKKQGKGPAGLTTISLTKDGVSIAKKLEKDVIATQPTIWKEFADWYKNYTS